MQKNKTVEKADSDLRVGSWWTMGAAALILVASATWSSVGRADDVVGADEATPLANQEAVEPVDAEPASDPSEPIEDGTVVTSQHQITVDGEALAFTASAGTIALRGGADNAETGTIFHIAYTLNDVEDHATRPVTFFFNGGPGSSSVWLHLGAFGPFRCSLDDEGIADGPPYGLHENPFTLLKTSDLVFIDPVTTGFSRPSGETGAQAFRSVSGDINSVAQFIRRYLSENERWPSPVYVGGESYGTTRAAGLVQRLQDRHGIYPNGVILVSSVLHFQTIRHAPMNDVAYATFLPTFTAVAHYHEKLALQDENGAPMALDAALSDVEAFVMERYWPALLRGQTLDVETRNALAAELESYTGLPADLWLESNLRVGPSRFRAELLDGSDRVAGRFDGRYTLPHLEPASPFPASSDPSYALVHGAFTSGIHQLLGRLGYESDLEYEIISGGGWDFEAENGYLETATRLERAMNANPRMKVYVASGFYDLATPYFAARHVVEQIFSPEDQARFTFKDFPSGHMMFVHRASQQRLVETLGDWYESEVAAD